MRCGGFTTSGLGVRRFVMLGIVQFTY
jgi:hypothetical protein